MPEHRGGDHWTILHGDAMRIVPQFEKNAFDAVITDPPYASGVAKAGQMLLDRMAAAFRRYAFPAAEETRFALATLGNDAGIWGA